MKDRLRTAVIVGELALALVLLAPVVVLLRKGMPRFGWPRDVVARQG